MSVPTTLHGTHDGCGGTVEFRPADHAAELRAGATVVLHADCVACGVTLSTPWSLPAPVVADSHPDPAALGEWRMPDRDAAEPAGAEAGAEATDGDATRAPAPVDPALDHYLAQVSARVAAARENLRRVSAELPFAVAPREGESTFRPARLARPEALPAAPGLRPAAVDAASVELPQAPAEVAHEPSVQRLGRPFEPAPRVQAAASAAIAEAVASPSFLTDTIEAPDTTEAPAFEAPAFEAPAFEAPAFEAPAFEAPELEAPAEDVVAVAPPAVEPQAPATADTEVVEPATPVAVDVFQPLPSDEPLEPHEPASDAPSEAPELAGAEAHEPAPVQSAALPDPVLQVAVEAPVVPAEPAPTPEIAPTDDDVFPPVAPAQLVAAHPQPEPEVREEPALPAMPAPVLVEAAVAAPHGDAFWSPEDAENDAAAAAVDSFPVSVEDAAPAAGSASFADAFADAAALTPFADAATGQLPDASVAFEADRGFDWSGLDDEERRPRLGRARKERAPRVKRPRRGRRARTEDTVDAPADAATPVGGPGVLAAPESALEPVASPSAPRSSMWLAQVVLVLMLAVVAGLAGMKIVTSRDVLSQAPADPAAAATDIAPAATGPGATAAGGDAPAAGAGKKASGKRAGAKRSAAGGRASGEQVPKISRQGRVAGTTAGDRGAAALADAAAGAKAPQKDPAQVRAGAADTPAVTATEASGQSNPFARP